MSLSQYAFTMFSRELTFAEAATIALLGVPGFYYLLAGPRLAEAPESRTEVLRTSAVRSPTWLLLATNLLLSQHSIHDRPRVPHLRHGSVTLSVTRIRMPLLQPRAASSSCSPVPPVRARVLPGEPTPLEPSSSPAQVFQYRNEALLPEGLPE